MADAKKLAKLRHAVMHKVAAYGRLFATQDGRTVLADLRKEFCDRSSIVPGDPYQTHAREGAREVILFIENNIRSANSHVEGMDDDTA